MRGILRGRNTIRRKLCGLLVMQIVVLLVWFGSAMYIEITNTVQKNEARVQQMTARLYNLLESRVQTLSRTTAFPVLRNLNGLSTELYKYMSSHADEAEFAFSAISSFENDSSEVLNLNQNVDRVCVVNLSGYGLLVDRKNLWSNSSVFSMDMSQLWVQHTLGLMGKATDLFSLAPEQWFGAQEAEEYLYCARAIVNAEKYQAVGLCLVGLDAAVLRDAFETEKLYEQQQLMVFDTAGQPVYGTADGFDLVTLGGEQGNLECSLDGERYMISYHAPETGGFGLAVLTPQAEVMRMISAYYLLLYVAIAVLTLITLVISTGIMRSLQKPINQLVSAVQAYAEGKLSTRVTVTGAVEFKILADSLNNMSQKIESLIDEVYVQKLETTEYEIKVLRNQINPHFLYNALDSARMKAYLSHDDRVEQMLTSLADVLRYGLNNSCSHASLEGELENINQYLRVVNFCSAKPIRLQVHIHPEVSGCMMPRVTLQPVVENCIKHGFAKGAKEGTITLYGYIDQEDCIIQVNDDGCGMNRQQLTVLQSELDGNSRPDGKNTDSRIGLYNVHRRIRLLLGEPYGLSVQSVEGRGMSVSIRLPFAQREEQR